MYLFIETYTKNNYKYNNCVKYRKEISVCVVAMSIF